MLWQVSEFPNRALCRQADAYEQFEIVFPIVSTLQGFGRTDLKQNEESKQWEMITIGDNRCHKHILSDSERKGHINISEVGQMT